MATRQKDRRARCRPADAQPAPDHQLRRPTVGADKACDTKNFIAGARALNVTAQVQKNEQGRRSHLDQRTTRHAGYSVSLSRRWLIEKTFGWLNQTGPLGPSQAARSPPYGIAIDRSGCVGLECRLRRHFRNDLHATSFILTEIIGAAAPTRTPLAYPVHRTDTRPTQ